jgi:ATP adenylyltransferase
LSEPDDPQRLLALARRATEQALASGALRPIATRCELVRDRGLPFVVRVAAEVANKPRAGAAGGAGGERDPFAPYDPEMFVADVSASHVALLNKFPVVDGHLLFVTRDYEEQDAPLTLADFESFAWGLAAIDGLGFYNSGPESGASQRHKHLQLVTLPFACESGPDAEAGIRPETLAPVDALLGRAGSAPAGALERCPALPFAHALTRLEVDWSEPPAAARTLGALHDELRAATGLAGGSAVPYNLLLTRRWMLLVPRSAECWRQMSVNALGFAGSLFVRDDEQLDRVRRLGPMAVLRNVALAS